MNEPVTVQPDSFLTLHYRLSGLDGTEPPIPTARRLMCSHLLADGQVRTLD